MSVGRLLALGRFAPSLLREPAELALRIDQHLVEDERQHEIADLPVLVKCVDLPVPADVGIVRAKPAGFDIVEPRLVDAVVDDHQIEMLVGKEAVLLPAVPRRMSSLRRVPHANGAFGARQPLRQIVVDTAKMVGHDRPAEQQHVEIAVVAANVGVRKSGPQQVPLIVVDDPVGVEERARDLEFPVQPACQLGADEHATTRIE